MTTFRRLRVFEWQQFRNVDIQFHDRLTVVTGANASGKTTLLNLLGMHVSGWDVQSLAIPQRAKNGIVRFLSRLFGGEQRESDSIGSLTYASGREVPIKAPDVKGAPYRVDIPGREAVPCFFLPAHRSIYRYERLVNLPADKITRDEAFSRVWDSTRNRFFGGGGQPASFHIKEVLIHWSLFGRGNSDMPGDPERLELYEGFQEVLRNVLPETLGFKKFVIINNDLLLKCSTTDFMIDSASGGLSALIDLAWQVYMFPAGTGKEATVLVDEIENHLHPTMQRRVLGDLLKSFPNVRFVITTHSPLVVSSVRDSNVFALRYGSDRLVTSERLDLVHRARTANQILDEVLGVSTTIPPWAELALNNFVLEFGQQPMTERTFGAMRERLSAIGLADYLPLALGKVVDEFDK